MKYFAAIALISFIAIGVFGFAGLMSQGAFMHCAKALAGVGGSCPGAFAGGLLHIQLYQGFSQALIAAAQALFFFAISYALAGPFIPNFEFAHETNLFEFSENSFRERIHSWISLHQTSDPLV